MSFKEDSRMGRKRRSQADEKVVLTGELVKASGKPLGRRGFGIRQGQPAELPPILAGNHTQAVAEKVHAYYLAIAEIYERWVTRRDSPHTQRAYRQDFMSLVEFLGIVWPDQATRLFQVTVADVQAWKDDMLAQEKAPKTINRRVSSVSSFFKYLGGVAAEMRLPITVPNPAHSQFIARMTADPVDETLSLSATRARQLMGLPSGEDLVPYRDRAILRVYLYSGIRLSTACRLMVSDFRQEGDEATIRISEKGGHRRTIGLHFAAAEAVSQYLAAAQITRGPIFRPRAGSRTSNLAKRALTPTAMYLIVMGYLEQLPGAMQHVVTEDDDESYACVYSPHSLRATTATLLLDAGVEISKVQELLGHKHITTTQIYDKRRRGTKESASHDVPI